jgi:hypothetical protein
MCSVALDDHIFFWGYDEKVTVQGLQFTNGLVYSV